MEITTVGLDLGMSFRFTSIGSAGGVVVRRSLGRAQVIPASSRRVSSAWRRAARAIIGRESWSVSVTRCG